ncbi:MAG: serine/threonine-protein kinase [Nannocystaceae bacterium]
MGSGDPERSSAGADARGLDSVAPNDATTKVGDPSARWVEGRLRRDDDHLLDGPILVGRYVVLDRLGQGAMGEVMLAYDPKLLREVALKLVFAAGGDASARMLREAQALAQLNHPNVVGIYDVGEHEGSVFMAMEYVRGRTLRQWLEQAPRSWREVVAVLRQAGRGLAAAHRAGLVHRDVKPDNILVADDGRVCVADFGLARADAMVAEASGSGEIASHSDPELAVPLTQTGTVLGTLAYMAPEQHQGAVADAAVDQYALCVTAYEALLGRRPFGARDLLASKLAGPPAPPGDAAVPRVIVRAVLRGLAPKPADPAGPRSRRCWWPRSPSVGGDPRRARCDRGRDRGQGPGRASSTAGAPSRRARPRARPSPSCGVTTHARGARRARGRTTRRARPPSA